MINKQEQKGEAVKRMKLMELYPQAIEDFEKDNIVHYSEGEGALYWVSNSPKMSKYIEDFEIKYGALVYHAQLSYLEFGRCLSLFYVSRYKSEWDMDNDDIKNGRAVCYVWNMDDEYCSEFGTILFEPSFGGVRRIG